MINIFSNLSTKNILLLGLLAFFVLFIYILTQVESQGRLNVKSKRVGDGQHGTARFSTKKEIKETYHIVPYTPKLWRKQQNLPTNLGLIVGTEKGNGKTLNAFVDDGDIHTIMSGAAGTGKTAFFLYPNIEYACACGMSFITTDTKGDLARNYGNIAKKYYGYAVNMIDLRNPTKSQSFNLMQIVNKYMDLWKKDKSNLKARATAEKHAKIIAKSIINLGDFQGGGQNAYFYDSAEGIITSVILLVSELLPKEQRHIVTVFKILVELLNKSGGRNNKNDFQMIIEKLPLEHKAKWFASAGLEASGDTMASVMSTALSRLLSFIDTEIEQILCFDNDYDTEYFINNKTAVFIILPEEDNTKYFIVSLILQQYFRELMILADENGGKLPKKAMIYADEIGTIPKIDGLDKMFSAIRSRNVCIVGIIQSSAQLEKTYGKDGAKIIVDNCQCFIFGGFAPQSQDAENLSKSLGTYTVQSGSVNQNLKNSSLSKSMMSRQLITADELKTIPKGTFIVTRTGKHPLKTKLPLFLKWGIKFDCGEYDLDKKLKQVKYGDKDSLNKSVIKAYGSKKDLIELLSKSIDEDLDFENQADKENQKNYYDEYNDYHNSLNSMLKKQLDITNQTQKEFKEKQGLVIKKASF